VVWAATGKGARCSNLKKDLSEGRMRKEQLWSKKGKGGARQKAARAFVFLGRGVDNGAASRQRGNRLVQTTKSGVGKARRREGMKKNGSVSSL